MNEGNRDGVSPLSVQWGRGNASLKSRTKTPQGDRTLTAPAHHERRQFHFATWSTLFARYTEKPDILRKGFEGAKETPDNP